MKGVLDFQRVLDGFVEGLGRVRDVHDEKGREDSVSETMVKLAQGLF